MKKKQIIKQFEERIANLEKQVKPNSITLIDPDNENKSVVIGISGGVFSHDIHVKNNENKITNITNQPV